MTGVNLLSPTLALKSNWQFDHRHRPDGVGQQRSS
jgi:hypothetical protein